MKKVALWLCAMAVITSSASAETSAELGEKLRKELKDLNKHMLKEFANFFETYKNLKGKPAITTIHGYKGRSEAIKAIEHSRELYKNKFGK